MDSSAEEKKEQAEHDEHDEHEDHGDHDGARETRQRYICLHCIDKAEDLDDRYHMFVRCPAKAQDDDNEPIESVVKGLRDRLSLVEASQTRLEGKLETLLDRLEVVLQRPNAPQPYPTYYQNPGYSM